jgi:predicted enzyme related to lactoylglutathione lyase
MSHPTFGNGKICYLEIPTTDAAVSAEFYQTVFGWRVRKNNEGYLSFDDSVGEVSGSWVTHRKAVADPGVLIHIMVDDAKETIGKIVAAGGAIVQPIGDAPEITATFSDPMGNVFGIYQHRSSK